MTLSLVGLDKYLRAEGCTVELLPDWDTRGHAGTLSPDGGLLHHTAGHKDLGIVLHGRPDLAGPLANLYLRQNGHVVLVAAGVCWHAGRGSQQVHSEILRETVVTSDPRFDAASRDLPDDMSIGNLRYLGIEVENDGVEPLTAAQLDALPRVMAGCVRFNKSRGWKTAYRWRHHRQHTRRKVDMHHRGDLWTAANARLKPIKVVNRVANRVLTPKPTPIAPPAPAHREIDMLIVLDPDSPKQFVCDATTKRHITQGERAVYVAAGVPYVDIPNVAARREFLANLTEAS